MKRSVFFLFYVASSLVLTLSFVHCVKRSDAPTQSNELLFGEYGSMTGSESSFGLSTHKGIMMAIDEVNAAGGVKGKKVRVISYDDQGKSDEAVTAVTKLITQDKVAVVLGEVASSRSIAAASVAQQYKIPMVSPASTNPKVTEIGEYIFRVCFIDPFQGSVMAKFVHETLKLKKAAILTDIRSDYSVGLAKYFEEDFIKRGGKIIAKESYSTGDMDFNAQLNSINKKSSEKPDVLFVPGYYTEVGLIARQARDQKFKGLLLGGDGWDSDKLAEIGKDAIVGGYFSNHYSPDDKSPVVRNFVAQFKARFNEVPDSMAALAYDAARIAIEAAKTAKDLSPSAIRDTLATTANFKGVTGLITINPDRNAVKSAVVLKVAKNNSYEYITTINP